jgi:hypothetical protein
MYCQDITENGDISDCIFSGSVTTVSTRAVKLGIRLSVPVDLILSTAPQLGGYRYWKSCVGGRLFIGLKLEFTSCVRHVRRGQ